MRSLPLFLLLTSCTMTAVVGQKEFEIIDIDQDLTPADQDCDDLDGDRHPAAIERCDGKDNNCDGLIDAVAPVAGQAITPSLVCERRATFTQNMRLDLLFVIDNSNTMLDSQAAIADGVQDLLQWVVGPDLDTHIGAISTDMDDLMASGLLAGVHGKRYADGKVDDGIEAWAAQALMLGIAGSGDERPLDATLAALDGRNAGFRRPDAHLAVVVLTDEDDHSTVSTQDFLHDFRNHGRVRGARLHGLLSDEEACSEVVGIDLLSVIEATGGFQESICASDYGLFLSAVGQDAAQRGLLARFPLPTPAQLGSITVQVQYPGGFVELLDPSTDVALSPTGDAVVLLNPPPAGSRLTVRWLAQPGSVE